MPPVTGEPPSAAAEQAKPRRPRIQLGHAIQETSDPRPNKLTISSLLLNSGEPAPSPAVRRSNFSPASKFRGMGCTAGASQQVSVPTVIRASADWERRKAKKKGFMQKGCRGKSLGEASALGCNSSGSCVVAEDAWCGPGIGFSPADADCVVVVGRRNVATAVPAASRGNIDAERLGQRERPCLSRRTVNHDHLCLLDSEQSFPGPRPGVDVYGSSSRHHRHARPTSPEGFAEIMMLHGGMIMGGRPDGPDRYRGWRLDVDNMSYEQLLELSDRIGYVNTGLKDNEIGHCIRKIKLVSLSDLSHYFATKTDGKCSICQEEYEEDDELGKLECRHGFHLECIKQWLSHKNICPVCKSEAVART